MLLPSGVKNFHDSPVKSEQQRAYVKSKYAFPVIECTDAHDADASLLRIRRHGAFHFHLMFLLSVHPLFFHRPSNESLWRESVSGALRVATYRVNTAPMSSCHATPEGATACFCIARVRRLQRQRNVTRAPSPTPMSPRLRSYTGIGFQGSWRYYIMCGTQPFCFLRAHTSSPQPIPLYGTVYFCAYVCFFAHMFFRHAPLSCLGLSSSSPVAAATEPSTILLRALMPAHTGRISSRLR